MSAVLVIVILQNDNVLFLQASEELLMFSEDDRVIEVGTLSGVTLVDEDREAMMERLVISLEGSLEVGVESLVVDTLSVLPEGGLVSSNRIEINRLSSIQSYQVRYHHKLHFS